jgi:hypothetical protein
VHSIDRQHAFPLPGLRRHQFHVWARETVQPAGPLDAPLVSERATHTGQPSPVEFERVWADVWNSLPAPAPRDRS